LNDIVSNKGVKMSIVNENSISQWLRLEVFKLILVYRELWKPYEGGSLEPFILHELNSKAQQFEHYHKGLNIRKIFFS
jgi:hypothetical protein